MLFFSSNDKRKESVKVPAGPRRAPRYSTSDAHELAHELDACVLGDPGSSA